MEKNEEYIMLQMSFKGESWDKVKSSLISDLGFTAKMDYEFVSPKTGYTYRFSVIDTRGECFVSRIEVMMDGKFYTSSYSVCNKDEFIQKYDESLKDEKDSLSGLKKDVIEVFCSGWSIRAFSTFMNQMNDTFPVQRLKARLGMGENEEFCFLHFLELEFECESRLCKIVRRKPSSMHRAIKTPYGTVYAIPVKGTFEDLLDCIISKRLLLDAIGLDGILDVYEEDE